MSNPEYAVVGFAALSVWGAFWHLLGIDPGDALFFLIVYGSGFGILLYISYWLFVALGHVLIGAFK
jgi:hypothetical protein